MPYCELSLARQCMHDGSGEVAQTARNQPTNTPHIHVYVDVNWQRTRLRFQRAIALPAPILAPKHARDGLDEEHTQVRRVDPARVVSRSFHRGRDVGTVARQLREYRLLPRRTHAIHSSSRLRDPAWKHIRQIGHSLFVAHNAPVWCYAFHRAHHAVGT